LNTKKEYGMIKFVHTKKNVKYQTVIAAPWRVLE
jgi:hypothetical protein